MGDVSDMTYNFTVLIEQDESGSYVATVPSLKSCYTQAGTVPEVLEKIREAISLCLEVEKDFQVYSKFVGVQQIEIAV
jgi:predicted RNase H-like HicB family nuclease